MVNPGSVEHAKHAWSDTSKSETDVMGAAIKLVVDDFAHAGGIHIRNTAEIENGVARQFGATKQRAKRENVIQNNRTREAQDHASRIAAWNRFDLQWNSGHHGWISLGNEGRFVARKLVTRDRYRGAGEDGTMR